MQVTILVSIDRRKNDKNSILRELDIYKIILIVNIKKTYYIERTTAHPKKVLN